MGFQSQDALRTPLTIADTLVWGLVTLGLTILVGWCTGTPSLVRLSESGLPMQADAALGFVIVGFALHALARGRRQVATVLASSVTTYAAISVAQFTLRADWGLHHWHTHSSLVVPGIAATALARARAFCSPRVAS